jgi:hypothetical protein
VAFFVRRAFSSLRSTGDFKQSWRAALPERNGLVRTLGATARSAKALSATDYGTLAAAARDVDAIGRIRGSSEVHGAHHLRRGHMLASLRRLESAGYVQRVGHRWETGTVTAKARHYLKTTLPPRKLNNGKAQQGGIATDGGTRFKSTLADIGTIPALSSGEQNHKLGRIVAKGRHKGLPMRAITLEEGRTCPLSCALRPSCYGGGMPFAKRLIWRGEKTGIAIAKAVATSGPTMVRLHTLGDFPSFQYAQRLLHAVTAAGGAAFGFTHHQPETAIGKAIRALSVAKWETFSIRTSYLHGTREPIPERSAVIVAHPDQAAEHNAVVCPEQMGRAPSCAACGYCWHATRPVAFVLHENLAKGHGVPTPASLPAVPEFVREKEAA